MAPSEDTSFAAHTAAQFTSYEQDRQTKSQQTLYNYQVWFVIQYVQTSI